MRVGHGDTAYQAFVPHPLPPVLQLAPDLVRMLSDADRALGELAGLGRTVANPKLLIRPFIHREAVLSSRIEGTQAKLADLYAYEVGHLALASNKPSPADADVREVHNYVDALEYGIQRLATLPISLRLIRELHERLMTGVRGNSATPGEFRRSQNWIGRPGSTLTDAEFVPPPVPEMQTALSALEQYCHQECQYPPLVRIGLIHYQFEAIHPFLDGNGRIGRLLISLLLVHWELLPLPLLYLSAFFERQRQDYYAVLLAVSTRSAWREWLTFFLRGVHEQARDAVARAKRLQDLQQAWRQQLQVAPRTSVLLLQLVDELFQTPALTVPHVQKLLNVTHRAANQMVARLVRENILRAVPGHARNRQFVAHAILEVLNTERP
jgi:Fic family protein